MGSTINLADADFTIHVTGEQADFQRETVADILGRRNKNFPGAQPVSFARRHLSELRQRDYFMCEKTDGLRCLLFLTQTFNEQNQPEEALFFIDRRNDYYYVKRDAVHVGTKANILDFHRGTLLDGELVRQRLRSGQTRLAYLIFDCLALSQENITTKPFDKRLARIDEFVWKPLRQFAKEYPDDLASQPFQIEMKRMEFPYGMEMMFKDRIPNLPHGNDGLIFTCKGTPYVAGTDTHILKWKPPQENTIDFRLLLGEFPTLEDEEGSYEDWDAKPAMELHVNQGGREGYGFFAMLAVTDEEWEALKSLNQPLDGRIIECFRDPQARTWRPKLEENGAARFRDDKQDANHISVVDSVLESIEDAVTEGDLVAEAGTIRSAFKTRQADEAKKMKAAGMEHRRQQEAKMARGKQQMAHQQAEEQRKRDEDEDAGPGYN